MSNKIVTICYGERKEWDTRKEALLSFVEYMAFSEGSEQARYANVVKDLLSGLDVCTDGCEES